jgi:hypothetical protein
MSRCGDRRGLSIRSLRGCVIARLAIVFARDGPSVGCFVAPLTSWPPPHCVFDRSRERNDQERISFYWLSSWVSASLVTPETVPVNSPVAAKKTGLCKASANTGTDVSVNVSVPDAFLKRPVPPVI